MIEKRKYEQKLRAERQEETRRRITEATAALHQEIGPAQTTISAVAERAGVERLTVYRHFPSERELIYACQQHFRAQHPSPDPATWADIEDPALRLTEALTAFYAYYSETEAMTANVLHDAPLMPTLRDVLSGRAAYFSATQEQLASGWDTPAELRELLLAAVGHALDFDTWRSLVRRQGLTNEQAVVLMVRLVRMLAANGAANGADG